MRRSLRLAVALTGLFGLLAIPSSAQYDDDDQTDDHEEMDRRYQERYLKPAETPVEVVDPAAEEAAFLARMDQRIRDRNYRAASSDDYRVQTDDPRLDPDGAVALLGAFRVFFEGFWGESPEVQPFEEQSRVFLFYSFYKFNELLEGDFRFSDFRPKGHYGSWYDVITLHTDADSAGNLADTLVHEAAHQLVAQEFAWRDGPVWPWLSEGLASYFGHTRMNDAMEFQPGVIGGKQIQLFRAGRILRPDGPESRLGAFRKATEAGRSEERSLIETVLWASPQQFYSGEANVYYGTAWVLIHYLFHADGGSHADAFKSYLGLEIAGEGGPEVLLRELGMTGVELDRAVESYGRKLKAR